MVGDNDNVHVTKDGELIGRLTNCLEKNDIPIVLILTFHLAYNVTLPLSGA